MSSRIHPATKTEDEEDGVVRHDVVVAQAHDIVEVPPAKDEPDIRRLCEDVAQLEEDALFDFQDGGPLVDVVEHHRLPVEALDEELAATTEPKPCWRPCWSEEVCRKFSVGSDHTSARHIFSHELRK